MNAWTTAGAFGLCLPLGWALRLSYNIPKAIKQIPDTLVATGAVDQINDLLKSAQKSSI